MKIRWERRPGTEAEPGDRYSLVALLVDSCQSGDDRTQGVVAQLGAIEERFLSVRIRTTREFHQGLFWMRASSQLDKLKLDTHVRSLLEEDLAKTVPRPGHDWALWGVTCIPCFDP